MRHGMINGKKVVRSMRCIWLDLWRGGTPIVQICNVVGWSTGVMDVVLERNAMRRHVMVMQESRNEKFEKGGDNVCNMWGKEESVKKDPVRRRRQRRRRRRG